MLTAVLLPRPAFDDDVMRLVRSFLYGQDR
jgi:hypothetical protein